MGVVPFAPGGREMQFESEDWQVSARESLRRYPQAEVAPTVGAYEGQVPNQLRRWSKALP